VSDRRSWGILGRLFRRKPLSDAQEARIEDLEQQLSRQVQEQLELSLDWKRTREQLHRHLKQIAEVDRRLELKQAGQEQDGAAKARDLVLQMKLGRGGSQ
jgi:regulator of replication initiation timing